MKEHIVKYALTINFINKDDKILTNNILNNIKHRTGESQAVIVNKALRSYLLKLDDREGD